MLRLSWERASVSEEHMGQASMCSSTSRDSASEISPSRYKSIFRSHRSHVMTWLQSVSSEAAGAWLYVLARGGTLLFPTESSELRIFRGNSFLQRHRAKVFHDVVSAVGPARVRSPHNRPGRAEAIQESVW